MDRFSILHFYFNSGIGLSVKLIHMPSTESSRGYVHIMDIVSCPRGGFTGRERLIIMAIPKQVKGVSILPEQTYTPELHHQLSFDGTPFSLRGDFAPWGVKVDPLLEWGSTS